MKAATKSTGTLSFSASPKVFILSLIICLFAFQENIQAKKKPHWVKQRPNDPAYYLGIGMAPKTDSEFNYVQEARNKALKEMSSEIKVTVSSNSVLHQFENNFEFREEYESKVQTSVAETLEGYEVETWEDKKEYWVMTRLSKERYKRMRQMKLDKAKTLATAYYMDAQKAIAQNNAFSALTYLGKSVVAIKDHLEEDLTHRTVDGTYNVGAEIFRTIQDVFHRIELAPMKSTYYIQFSKQLEVPIKVKASFYDNQGEVRPLSNFPLKFEFTKGEGLLSSQSSTDRDGLAKVAVTRLISKRKMQEIQASFDFSHILTQEPGEEIIKVLKVFFPVKVMPTANIGLEVQKSTAYLEMSEVVFGDKSQQGPFSNTIKTELNENFFTFTNNKEEADFFVTVSSDFVSGEERKGQGYSVFLVFANFNIAIVDAKTNVEIFSDGVNSVRGMRPGNYEYALKDARIKALEAFRKQVVPRLEQVDM
ncbi:hypothetical protein DMA11_02965 [Marinilabiliaceae bacterium JC017]|nr:hypothetical protein DMA11_02965 [Marinilabiliaceae bacterium JC017]